MTVIESAVSKIDIQNLRSMIAEQDKYCKTLCDRLTNKNKTTEIVDEQCSYCGARVKISYDDCKSSRYYNSYETTCPICGETILVKHDVWEELIRYAMNMPEYIKEKEKLNQLRNDLSDLICSAKAKMSSCNCME